MHLTYRQTGVSLLLDEEDAGQSPLGQKTAMETLGAFAYAGIISPVMAVTKP